MTKALALLAWLVLAPAVHAATVCRVVSGPGLAFGIYDTLSGMPNLSLSNITVTCDRNGGPQHVTVTMGLGPGSHSGSIASRRMAHTGGSGDFLNYELFQDSARSSIWGFGSGDSVAITVSVPNKGSASAVFTVYGRVPAQQDVAVGSYSDSIQVTLTP